MQTLSTWLTNQTTDKPVLHKPTVQVMVRQAQADPTAFAALYRHYVLDVYRYVFSKVGNHMETEDITSQIFMDTLHKLPTYRERGNFPAWLFTIARRRIADFYRQREQLADLDYTYVVDNMPPLLAHVAQTELQSQLADLIHQLPEEKQEWLRLRFAGGLSYKEIGKLVGKSTAAIKMGMNRLLKQLASELEVQA